jgi:hypothetical protein
MHSLPLSLADSTQRLLALTLFVLCSVAAPQVLFAQTLVPAGSVWKYLDNGSNQGTAWRAVSFNDSGWASGPAQLGYGDGDEATVVGFGPSASNKYVTTYFRHSFTVNNPSAYTSLRLRLLRDDGAVVYLNGTEVLRSNMPAGTISFTTLAVTWLGEPEESTFVETSVNPGLLVSGVNVLAVEVHQATGDSSDLSFDLELIEESTGSSGGSGGGSTAPVAPSGLIAATASSSRITLSWSDNSATESGFKIERSTDNVNFTEIATVGADVTSYTNTGLRSNRTYYYRVRAYNAEGSSPYSNVASAKTFR